MYEAAADVAINELTFRPHVPGTPDVLLPGTVRISRNGKTEFIPESSHLACFAGGMFAMGARALGRAHDLEAGAKLTDGCVWAYASMRSGIMAEKFKVQKCADKKSCKFDREAWIRELEPPQEYVDRRNSHLGHTSPEAAAIAQSDEPTRTRGANDGKPLTRHDYALDLIEREELPDGYLEVLDRRYILRPEAIESVWYMHRITADAQWAEKGWTMWKAVIRGVEVESGGPASAIDNVMADPEDEDWEFMDSLESFWFGG